MLTNNIENIRFENDWVETENYNYRISKTFNQIRLHVVPRSLGTQQLSIPVKVKKPILNSNGELVFDLPLIEQTFSVSQSRLQFLNVDRNEVTLDDSTRSEGIEIQIENNRMLIRNREEEGKQNPGIEIRYELMYSNNKELPDAVR